MCFSYFCKRGIIHGLSITKGTVRLQNDTFGSEVVDGILSVQERVDLNLIDNRFRCDSIIEKFFVVFNCIIAHTDIAYLALLLQLFKCFVCINMFARYWPVD